MRLNSGDNCVDLNETEFGIPKQPAGVLSNLNTGIGRQRVRPSWRVQALYLRMESGQIELQGWEIFDGNERANERTSEAFGLIPIPRQHHVSYPLLLRGSGSSLASAKPGSSP